MRFASLHDEDFTLRELAKALGRYSTDVLFQIETEELRPVFVSPSYSTLWKLPVETAYSRPSSWHTSIHPADFPRTLVFLRNEAARGPAETEYRVVWPSGEVRWIWFRTFPVVQGQGQVRRVIAVAQDCTQRRQDARTRGFLASIVESSDDSIIGTDLNGAIVSWNQSAERLFGYAREEAIGQSIEILRPREITDYHSILRRIEQSERIERFETVRLSKDGTPIDVSVILSPIRDLTGTIIGVSGIYHDIRARKHEEMARMAMERKLLQARKLESVGRLAAGIAHEINTPVQFVSDSVEFLDISIRDLLDLLTALRTVRDASLSAGIQVGAETTIEKEREIDLGYILSELPQAVERAREGLDRVASIVRSTKEFAHSNSSGMCDVDLNRSIESTLAVARSEYKYVADVETDFGDLPPIRCNGGEINQVVLNLVVNSAHAIGDVVAGTAGKGTIRVETSLEDGFAVIRVQDTGGGIPDDVRERIFDPFFTTKEVGRGTGQGLAISRSVVVENHGGSIDVDVNPGIGTTFTIRLPIAGRPPEGGSVAAAWSGEA